MVFDGIVLAVLLISGAVAFFRGFIREILTIMGVVGGTMAAVLFGPMLSPSFRNMFDGEGALLGVIPRSLAADVSAYGLIFIVVVIVLSVLSHFISARARDAGLGSLDRTLGVIFGFLRGAILLTVLYLPLYLLAPEEDRDTWFEGSKTRPAVEVTASWASAFLPIEEQTEEAENIITDIKIEKIKKQLDEFPLEELQEKGVLPEGYEDMSRKDMERLIEKKLEEME